jgi:hypothetical protein
VADPNWLLSAVAQSTAALVAIVGGLIVARLISLSAERTTLERQVQLLVWRQQEAEASAQQLRAEMVAEDASDSIEEWTEALMMSRPEGLTDEELLEVSNPGDWLPTDYTEHIAALRGSFDHGLAALLALVEAGRLEEVADADLPDDAEGLAAFGVEPPSEPEGTRVWDKIVDMWHDYELERRRNERPRPFDIFGVISRPLDIDHLVNRDPVLRSADLARRAQDERDYLARQAQAQALEYELEVLRTSLADATDPSRLWWGFLVLIAFSLLGIGLPMILMALGPVELSTQWRLTVIISFGVGLTLLFIYIALFVRALQPASEHAQS